MSKLPTISGKDLIKSLTKQGYYIRGQTGSHVHLRHLTKLPVTVPNHPTISKGTLNAIIKELGLTREEFMNLTD